MTRTKSTYLALLAVLLSPMAANADVIVDFSPDAVGAGADVNYLNSLDFPQNIGESFTLTEATWITGGSFFGGTGGQPFGGVGSFLEFGIFADDGFGAPGALVVNEIVAVDMYDSTGTTLYTDLSRYHTTLLTSVLLGPGNYFFTLPSAFGEGEDPLAAACSGCFGDDGVWAGFDSNIDLEGGFFPGTGDAFFQVEGRTVSVPEPGTLALLSLGLLGLGLSRRMKA